MKGASSPATPCSMSSRPWRSLASGIWMFGQVFCTTCPWRARLRRTPPSWSRGCRNCCASRATTSTRSPTSASRIWAWRTTNGTATPTASEPCRPPTTSPGRWCSTAPSTASCTAARSPIAPATASRCLRVATATPSPHILWFDRGNLTEGASRPPTVCRVAACVVHHANAAVAWPLGSLAAEQAAGRWLDSVEADPPVGGALVRKLHPAFGLAGDRPRIPAFRLARRRAAAARAHPCGFRGVCLAANRPDRRRGGDGRDRRRHRVQRWRPGRRQGRHPQRLHPACRRRIPI